MEPRVRTDRTAPNNKTDVTIRDKGKRKIHVARFCSFWRQKYDQKRS